jgi:hypothetical protein
MKNLPTPQPLPLKPANLWGNLRSLVIFCFAVILAGLPSALVVAEAWLGILSPVQWRDELWCKVQFLCMTFLPSYLALALVSFMGLALFMFFVRNGPQVVIENHLTPLDNATIAPRQARLGAYLIIAAIEGLAVVVLTNLVNKRYPGWDLAFIWFIFLVGWFLRAYPLGGLLDFWKREGELWVALLLAHFSIVAVLLGYYGQPGIFWGTVLMLLLAMANLWRFRRRVPLIFWIISLALVLYSLNINSWWIAVVGDEYSFEGMARLLAQKPFLSLGKYLFDAMGVYGQHTFLSSILQVIAMKFLGTENFGWRFGTQYLAAIGVGFFYLFCKTFIEKRAALLAACLLAVSSYIISFGKIGYNNLQALFALYLALAATAWALRSRSWLAFAGLGSVLAFCFYAFAAALYIIPLPFLLLLFFYPPLTRQAAGRWLLTIAVCLVMIYPLMLQPDYWRGRFFGTFLAQPEVMQSPAAILTHLGRNFFYALLSPFYIAESHYIAVSYLDPFSSALMSIGFWVLLYQMRRQRFAIFVMLGYLFYLVLVGTTHGYGEPPNTRMFMLLPFWALLAAWGLLWLEARARSSLPPRAGWPAIFIPALLIAITGANIYQSGPLAFQRYGMVQHIQSLFVRISENVYRTNPDSPWNYALIVNDLWGPDGLSGFRENYPHLTSAELHLVHIDEPTLPPDSLPLLAARNTIIILSPWLEPSWPDALAAPLQNLGKQPCIIYAPNGQKRFILYYFPGLEEACAP